MQVNKVKEDLIEKIKKDKLTGHIIITERYVEGGLAKKEIDTKIVENTKCSLKK